jgi:hypothetical protein
MLCFGCNKLYQSNFDLYNHQLICINYIYKTKYNKNINTNLINCIIDIIYVLNLYKIKTNGIISKDELLILIKVEYKKRKNIINFHDKYNQFYIIEYIYNLLIQNNKENYTFNDLINIISELYHTNKFDIHNIINCFKECQKYILV